MSSHDEALRDYLGIAFGEIQVMGEYIHELADGRRFLLLRGDEFDQITRHHRWIALLGDVMYDLLVRLNAMVSFIRRRFGMSCYWFLAGYAKRKVKILLATPSEKSKKALQFIFDFEDAAVRAARLRGLDGIICGHIHSAVIREMDGAIYANCGDWIDSCTAIVEHMDGRLELIAWGSALPGVNSRQDKNACES